MLQKKDLEPLTIKMNSGGVLSITGYNGGGKTVTTETIADTLYLAQSGLPVSADSMRFMPKELIGFVFIERGEGSLLELLFQKKLALINGIEASNTKNVFVLMDEAGAGTQERNGQDLEFEVLKKLVKLGATIVFNTQITSLAESAVTEFSAQSIHFTKDHKILSGIGTGGAHELAIEIGLRKVLV